MKKRRKKLKIVSFLLSISLLVTAFTPFTVFAEEPSHEQLTDSSQLWTPEHQEPLPNTEGDLPLEELETAVLTDEDKPEIISEDAITEKGHVNRLWEQESDLNTIIFQNRDGKKTMYYFTEPVKYKDKDGNIKDKKNKLTEQENTYTNAENDINSYFPKKIHKNKGVVLRHNDIEIEVAPLINGSSGASRQTGHNKNGQPTDSVVYPAVFDDSISVRYTPTFGGFKEDIILHENAGINEFSFKIKTNGLSLIQEEGSYYLTNPLTGEKVIQIGNIVVYDSKPVATTNGAESAKLEITVPQDKPELPALTEEETNALYFPEGDLEPIYNHYYSVQTIEEDNEYIITMSVDAAYLNSENTVYPVTIDPSITLKTSFSQDATIYSNYRVNEGYAANMFAGSYTNRYGGSRGVARSLVKFPGLFSNSTFNSLSASRIYKVQYILRDTMCESDAVWIDCYRVTQNWSEGTVKCNSSIWNAYTGILDDAYVYYNGGTGSMGTGTGHWYPFDITEAVKDWKNGLYGGTSNHYGIMLKAYNESNSAKTFGTNNNSSLGPNIIVEYDPAVTGISLSSTCKEVNVGWSGSIEATVYPASALNKTVYWESSDSNVASINPTSGLICAGLAGSTVITATTADGGFKATCTLTVIDPYAVSYVNLTKDSSGQYTIFLTKFNNGDFYFQAYGTSENNWGELYSLSQSNIDWLNNTYNAYYRDYISKGHSKDYSIDHKVYLAKTKLINTINEGTWSVSVNSDEFYGMWMHYTRFEAAYADATHLVAQMVQTAVIVGGVIYQGVALTKNISVLVGKNKYVSSNSYNSTLNGINAMNSSGPEASLYTNTNSITGLQNTNNFKAGSLNHVLKGEINSKGKAVGFHYEGMPGSQGSIVAGTKSTPNSFGVYEAKVQVNGILKTSNGGKSTFFPTSMSPQQIVDATNQAYANKVFVSGNTYVGIAENGMEISMYIDSAGKIISFFPNY